MAQPGLAEAGRGSEGGGTAESVRTTINGVAVNGKFEIRNGEVVVHCAMGRRAAPRGGIPDHQVAVMLLRDMFLSGTSFIR